MAVEYVVPLARQSAATSVLPPSDTAGGTFDRDGRTYRPSRINAAFVGVTVSGQRGNGHGVVTRAAAPRCVHPGWESRAPVTATASAAAGRSWLPH